MSDVELVKKLERLGNGIADEAQQGLVSSKRVVELVVVWQEVRDRQAQWAAERCEAEMEQELFRSMFGQEDFLSDSELDSEGYRRMYSRFYVNIILY